jgi:hypothetical protein
MDSNKYFGMIDNRTECLKIAECHTRQILSAGETLRNTLIEASGEIYRGFLVEQGTSPHTRTTRTYSIWSKDIRSKKIFD